MPTAAILQPKEAPAVVETPLYEEEEAEAEVGSKGSQGSQGGAETLPDYDMVLCTACDVNGSPRGRYVMKSALATLADEGVEVSSATGVLGFKSEAPTTVARYQGNTSPSRLIPDLSTLRPLTWLCQDGKKVGHVLCDLYTSSGDPDPHSPRQVALRQISRLRDLGYSIMSAHETEFVVFHKGTLNPLGGQVLDICNHLKMFGDQKVLYRQMKDLIASGIPIETLMKEYAPGQVEFSLEPQYGIKMADVVHRMRYAVKSVCQLSDLEATFMTRPQNDFNSNGYHFNHSLWTLDGKNAFYDPSGDHKCSDLMWHWLAGLIKHGDALTALYNPTVNCFERLHGFFAPSDNVWNYDDRNARLRVKTKRTNIYIEERTPSSACNPYLALAGLLAAGIDGIVNKLEPPPNREFRPLLTEDERAKAQTPLPKTLEEAMEALRADTAMTTALGEEFVEEYLALIKEFQLDKMGNYREMEPKERYEMERDLFFNI